MRILRAGNVIIEVPKNSYWAGAARILDITGRAQETLRITRETEQFNSSMVALGEDWAAIGRDMDRAVGHAEEATRISPRSALTVAK